MSVLLLRKPRKGYKLPKFHGSFRKHVGKENGHHKCCVVLQISGSLPSWTKGSFNTDRTGVRNLPTKHTYSICALLYITIRCVANATPPSTPPTDTTTQPATFTAAEVEHFQACLQESEDSRYVLWLQTFYPKQNATQGQGIMEAFFAAAQHHQHSKGHVTTHKVHVCSLVSSALWLWRRRLRRGRGSRRRRRRGQGRGRWNDRKWLRRGRQRRRQKVNK